MITRLAYAWCKYFSNLLSLSFQVVKIDSTECTSGMVAALNLCLTFVECDSTAKVHELQEVMNHDFYEMQRSG